ncbi:Transcription factor E2F/dimerization partner [Dirofilaria immitis]|nr:Transcription factor E2F/dimerization partner [Dirofilaria immitis]
MIQVSYNCFFATKTTISTTFRFFLKVLEYVNSGDDKINLESIACSMEVEKRRIYDVVNVMEALGAMEKSHKSFYTWKGLDSLPSTLHTLKHIMTQFMEIPNKSETVNVLDYQAYPDEAGPSRVPDRKIIPTAEQLNSLRNKDTSDYQPDYKVSLDVASTILINDPEIDGCKPPDRSRCRRIYDVANVLISLRLIERKMFTFGTKKIPLFMYCGPNIIEEKKTESSAEFSGPAEKRSRIEETDLIQGNIDLGKENIPSSLINHPIAKNLHPCQLYDLNRRAVPFSQTSSSFNVLQSVLQQPRFPRFMPLPVCAERFLSFDTNLILLNNGDMLHNPRGPIIDVANTSSTAYNNSNSSFISPRNTLRSSPFNIDAILGNREIHENNED